MITNRIKRGSSSTLPNGAQGEALFTTDTYDLYIGKGDGTNQRFQKYIASGTASQYLRGDGSLATHNLDSLTDVIITSPSNGQILSYNGSNWVNNALSGYVTGGATAAGQVGVWNSTSNIVGYTTFTFDNATDKLSMTNAYVNNNLTVDGQLVIKSESGASAYTRGLKFPDNSYGGTGDTAGLRLYNAGGENIILELYAGNDSLDTINFAVAAGGSTYNDNVTVNGNKIWNAGNLPSPLSSTGTINSGEIAIFSNSNTVYSDTALFWDNSLNRLGVGGNSPNAQVGVTTSSGVNAFGYRTSGALYYELTMSYDNTTYGHLISTGRSGSTSARDLTLLNNTTILALDESNNVGINTLSPVVSATSNSATGLDIYSSSNTVSAGLALHTISSGTTSSDGFRVLMRNDGSVFMINQESGGIIINAGTGNYEIITNAATSFKIDSSTNKVGINNPASIAEALTVNGSIQQSGVTNAVLKANASGKLIAAVANTDYIVGNFDATATVRARTSKTTYRNNSSNPPTDAPVRSLTNDVDNWIYLDSASTEWGIYHRNIDSTLSVAGQPDLPANSIAFIGANNLNAYICLSDGKILGKSFVRYNGTSSQFLKADGSIDSTSYQPLLTNPITGTGTSGYHAKFTGSTTLGNGLIYDGGSRAIAIGNSSVKSWASPFYVIEGGTYGQFLGYQTNAAAVKLGVNAYFNGSNYIYTNTGYGVAILDVASDSTNAYFAFYGAPSGTAGTAATLSPKMTINNDASVNIHGGFLGINHGSTPSSLIDARNAGNAIETLKNTSGGTLSYSSIRLTTANSGGVGDSIGEIRGISTNVNNRDTALTFLVSYGSTGQTEAMRITKDRNLNIGNTSDTSYKLNVNGTGNFTGALSGTSATFSGNVNTTNGQLTIKTTAFGGVLNLESGTTTDKWLLYHYSVDNSLRFNYNGSGGDEFIMTSTGAATFSSSVTAGGNITVTKADARLILNGTSALARIQYQNNGVTKWYTGINGYTDANAYSIDFGTTPYFYISSGGNVGINTTSPQKRLDVYTTANSSTEYQLSVRNGQGSNFVSSGMVFGFNTASADPDYLSAISSIVTNRTTRAADLTFLTAATGTLVERIRITSGGKTWLSSTDNSYGQLQIGNSTSNSESSIGFISGVTAFGGSPTSTNGNNYIWAVGAAIYSMAGNRFGIGNKGKGGVNVSLASGDTSWSAGTSDIRKKRNFETTQGLYELLQINPVKYHFDWDNDNDPKRLGFTAQNLLALIPEMVRTTGEKAEDGSDYLTITPDYLLPVIVKSIQELKAEIDTFKK